jgi:hypothetical protein
MATMRLPMSPPFAAHQGRGLSVAIPGLVPGIHVFLKTDQDVDGRNKRGHDGALGCRGTNAAWQCSPGR